MDWSRDLETVEGEDVRLLATLSHTGKAKKPDGEATWSDAYAELWERGVRRLVGIGRRSGIYCYSEAGLPVNTGDSEMGIRPGAELVQNRGIASASIEAMEALDQWGMF
jgi:hypothetical protein